MVPLWEGSWGFLVRQGSLVAPLEVAVLSPLEALRGGGLVLLGSWVLSEEAVVLVLAGV
jgi:hypothetical protein